MATASQCVILLLSSSRGRPKELGCPATSVAGWVYHHGWQLPNSNLEHFSRASMIEKAMSIINVRTKLVLEQSLETCKFRKWVHFASDCRSNHAHIVIGATNTHPMQIRVDIKAWCTRRLGERSRPEQLNWWAEGGGSRYIAHNPKRQRGTPSG